MSEKKRSIPLFKPFLPEGAHAALKPVLESGQLGAGPQVEAFESRLSAWFGTPDAVALSDASAALTLALFLSGVRPGDEVITSPLACSATILPIANLFSKPVWCDIDPMTGMPDPEHLAGLITERTRAILLYHWSGDVADVGGMLAVARQHGVKLVEEASEAWGAQWQGRRLGGEADFTVYSFYATKHINTGDGAVLLARDSKTARLARQLRRFGIDPTSFRLPNGDLNPDFDIPLAGFNFPMNEIAASLGLAQLPFSDMIVARHRANGNFYDKALAGIPGLRTLKRRIDSVSGFWTYSLLAERRDDLIRKLHSCGIGAQRLHLRNDRYSCFEAGEVRLPGVSAFDAQNLSLPCGWWVGEEERNSLPTAYAPGGEVAFEIRSCRVDELGQVISLLDDEFIFGKGRTISLRHRFPCVFSEDNVENILVCKEGAMFASALAIRQFKWREGGEIYDGAMIGTVYTHPSRRGQGLASQLLTMAATSLRAQGVDFCVLWAGQPSFYARLGWVLADASVLGTATVTAACQPIDEAITGVPLEGIHGMRLEALRESKLNAMILRRNSDFRCLPIPAERVDLVWSNNQAAGAYALFGRCGETIFLYELVGETASFASLWQNLCRGARRVLINDRLNSPSHRWLATHASITWERQSLTMCLPLSSRIDLPRLTQWHIPFFDRI